MRINAISFVYAARFVCSPKEAGRGHLAGILLEPQASGIVRLVATNGHCMLVVHDGAIQTEATRKTWIDPWANGLLSAARKGDFVTIRPDGVVEVEKKGAVIYVSPTSCERPEKVWEFPPYEQAFETRLDPKTRNYSLNAKYLEAFDLGHGVSVYPAGGNLGPLIVQPILADLGVWIQGAIGVIMPMRSEQESGYTLSSDYIETFLNRGPAEEVAL